MFFQTTGTGGTPSKNDIENIKRFTEAFAEMNKALAEAKNPLIAALKPFEDITLTAEALNKAFTGTRQRLQEMMRTISSAAPTIVSLGGSYTDAAETINDIASGTRRNVVASVKDVEDLFTVGKLLGQNVQTIVEEFETVGIQYQNIADNLEDSIVYVQRIGQNAKVVMADVVKQTEQLSRYNFNEGVMGLTKMAAQASRLRFDMKETFTFADKVLNPEDAVKMASAFQRLGVSVGNLTDPFQLMNQSINDPSGLQDSIINVAKSFTYFDEKTKSFRVSPQGILTMKALEDETGFSAENMRRTALAAAEMDDKLKKINTTGLNFDVSEEDKKMIANVARMGEGGEYEVSIKDDKGNEYQQKLYNLNKDDFQRLIKQQQEAPKTLEKIQEAQLSTSEKMLAEFKAVREVLSKTYFNMPGVLRNVNNSLDATRDVADSLRKSYEKSGFFEKMEEFKTRLQNIQDAKISEAQREREQQNEIAKLKDYMKASAPAIYDVFKKEIQTVYADRGRGATEMLNEILGKIGLGGGGRRLPPGRATGGLVRGPGTSTSDSIETRLSDGEFVVNAASTKAFLPLLNAINESGLRAATTGMNMKVSFDDKTPIPAELTVKLPPDFSSMPSYPAFTEYILQSPETVKQALLEVTEGALLRAGKIAKKGQYSVTT